MRVVLLVFSLSLILKDIIPDESNLELKRSVYSHMSKSIFPEAINYMQPEMSRRKNLSELSLLSLSLYPLMNTLFGLTLQKEVSPYY